MRPQLDTWWVQLTVHSHEQQESDWKNACRSTGLLSHPGGHCCFRSDVSGEASLVWKLKMTKEGWELCLTDCDLIYRFWLWTSSSFERRIQSCKKTLVPIKQLTLIWVVVHPYSQSAVQSLNICLKQCGTSQPSCVYIHQAVFAHKSINLG